MINYIREHLDKIQKKTAFLTAFKVVGIYTIANFANAAVPFLLMPIMTHYLTPTDYGIAAIFGILIGACTPFIGLNTQLAISIKFFRFDKSEFSKYVSSCISISIVNCIIVGVFFYFFHTWICDISKFPNEWLWSVIVVCFSANISGIYLTILRSTVQAYRFASMQLSFTVLHMGLAICFIAWLQMNWQGRIAAHLISIVIFAGISLYFLKRHRWLVFQKEVVYIRDALNFGVPLLPSNLSVFVISLADRFIIVELLGLSAAGVYAVGAQLAMVIAFITTSFNNAYTPWLFKRLNTASIVVKSKIVLMSYLYILAILILAVIVSWFLPFVLTLWIDKRFLGASEVILWACLAQAFNGLWSIVISYIYYIEKTYMELLITVPISMLHLVLCYFMVKQNGIVGAAQAATITCFIKILLGGILSNKLYPMPWFSFYKNSR